MKAIINGKIVLRNEVVTGRALLYDKKIIGIGDSYGDCEIIDARGGYVTPGLIDPHIHGYSGADCSDGTVTGLSAMAEGIARNGVTSFLATTMTLPYEKLDAAFDAIRSYMRSPAPRGARVLGVNAEGPFLSPEKRGAHVLEYLRLPDANYILKNSDIVRITTVAADLPGAVECVRTLTQAGIRVAIGHTTADFDIAEKLIDAGATQATHTFNAMPALNHRAPGTVGAVMGDDRVFCELIADGFHVHPAFFKILRRVKGDHLLLITDCTRAGGMGDGEYDLGGQKMYVRDKKCLLPNGTIAGSVLKLNAAVDNMMKMGGATVCEAVAMATSNTARALGLDGEVGALEMGKNADIAIFDADMNAMVTILGGEVIYGDIS